MKIFGVLAEDVDFLNFRHDLIGFAYEGKPIMSGQDRITMNKENNYNSKNNNAIIQAFASKTQRIRSTNIVMKSITEKELSVVSEIKPT